MLTSAVKVIIFIHSQILRLFYLNWRIFKTYDCQENLKFSIWTYSDLCLVYDQSYLLRLCLKGLCCKLSSLHQGSLEITLTVPLTYPVGDSINNMSEQ